MDILKEFYELGRKVETLGIKEQFNAEITPTLNILIIPPSEENTCFWIRFNLNGYNESVTYLNLTERISMNHQYHFTDENKLPVNYTLAISAFHEWCDKQPKK